MAATIPVKQRYHGFLELSKPVRFQVNIVHLNFSFLLKATCIAAQNSLNSHGQVVRVFNEDFVRDNIRLIVDNEQIINWFAILGEDNTNLEEEIENTDYFRAKMYKFLPNWQERRELLNKLPLAFDSWLLHLLILNVFVDITLSVTILNLKFFIFVFVEAYAKTSF